MVLNTKFCRVWLRIKNLCGPRWRHQMETFSALLALCAGNSSVSGEFPAQRPVTRSFDVFFDLRLIKRLSKHSRGWWFETLSRPLWRHCNALWQQWTHPNSEAVGVWMVSVINWGSLLKKEKIPVTKAVSICILQLFTWGWYAMPHWIQD